VEISALRAAAPRPPALGFPGNLDPLGLGAARDLGAIVVIVNEGTYVIEEERAVIGVG